MKSLSKVVILCSLYPNSVNPTGQVFIQQLVWSFVDMGIDCTVICPIAINQYPELKKLPNSIMETNHSGKSIKVYFPKYISAGQRTILGFKTARVTTYLYHKAVGEIFEKHFEVKPSVVYGHFFTPAGITAARIGRKYNIPVFVAYGESSPWSIHNFGLKKMQKEVQGLTGIVSVSTANKRDLEQLNFLGSNTKIEVFPNGIRTDHFYPRSKNECRKKFGFNQDDFIIAFTGHFSDRKGVLRLRDAAEEIDNVRVIYAGKGELDPISDNIIYKGLVKPDDMPYLLSAADVFVLPTLNEGCSNAIVEALACGLPVISSNLPFNEDVLDESNSILIDPTNIEEIRHAIKRVKNEFGLRDKLTKGAIAKSHELSLESRAENIKNWIDSLI